MTHVWLFTAQLLKRLLYAMTHLTLWKNKRRQASTDSMRIYKHPCSCHPPRAPHACEAVSCIPSTLLHLA